MTGEDANTDDRVKEAIDRVAEMSSQRTDGKWLEEVTALVGPDIREWDISRVYPWSAWPEREQKFPGTTDQDIGIDLVAIRRSDGEHIAIQCKARRLDDHGRGAPIHKSEIDKFAVAAAGKFWEERWIVTNGDNPMSGNALSVLSMQEETIKVLNIASDLQQQQASFAHEECPHCGPPPPPPENGEERRQTRTCMQNEAVAESVRILREHAQSESGSLPQGQARGKIILPCGTGKTRISLRIVEELTPPGELSIVLCPSIALVAQIRREYLQHAVGIRALAVCSDKTAGYDPKKESARNATRDPTVDNSNVSASEVKGKVTTDPAEIAQWIRGAQSANRVSVIFGTYQSGHRIAEALGKTDETVNVLIADEAHRTAGLRRLRTTKRTAKNGVPSEKEQCIRNFTLCHDNERFPATYRVYQTATPRVYDTIKVDRDKPSDWIVRSMDDETVFGVELYRKSYVEAVNNRWLSDYRIIALGVNDPEAFKQANLLATNTKSKGRRALTTTDYLRGLAFTLAMGGATQNRENGNVPIKSCIAFMNTVDKSKNMAQDLQTAAVRKWLQDWLRDNREGQTAAQYTLEHLDATSNVTARENAKLRLAQAGAAKPHGVINVGIFGEGTDSPSLNAVAFLEARKSPIDVIQAVGRAMRTAPGKEMGYIICPILIPPNANPEQWLSASDMSEGWQELGQILQALRAHDQRIEDNLADLLHLYLPKPPEIQQTVVAVAHGEERRIQYRKHEGPPGAAQVAVERALEGTSTLHGKEFRPVASTGEIAEGIQQVRETAQLTYQTEEPTQIVTGKKNHDGSIELRMDTVVRTKPTPDGTRGKVDVAKTKAKARNMINKGEGIRLAHSGKKRPTGENRAERSAMQMLLLSGLEEHGNAIKMNLLSKSGLTSNRVTRDLNILESSVIEAAHQIRNDGLGAALGCHFGLDNLKPKSRNAQADGCTIAALLMMNAAMLHQRIANGKWLSRVSDMKEVKHDVAAVRRVHREWNLIMRHDFRPVLEPAVSVIETIEDTGKLAGLEHALRHIAAEAERIAETYADMGADHAGPLFNRVMGNQASDGAYFTRPVAASIAARLTLDVCEDVDWSKPEVWRQHKTVDLACGSGTLLAALLADMKRRAGEQGANPAQIAELQKLAVEETIKGLDINPVSLQLAASQLTAGNQEIRYRQMGLHLMPYGPQADDPTRVAAGTPELLGQQAIVRRDHEMNLADDKIDSRVVWDQHDAAELEDAVDAAKDTRIVIMNPPFTNRAKMGEKFPHRLQLALRSRVDALETVLVSNEPALENFVDKNALRPLFVALADKCLDVSNGTLAMVNPTIALTSPSGQNERIVLARRYHIHTVVTCHQPGSPNLSQHTSINESIIVAVRRKGPRPDTRFINLDRLPTDDEEVAELHECLQETPIGSISNGWGEVSKWPASRIEAGDWTPAVWRSPELAEAAARFANDTNLRTIEEAGLSLWETGRLLRGSYERAEAYTPGSFPILKSKGTDGQTRIQSQPDEHWIAKKREKEAAELSDGAGPEAAKILAKAGHLLITAGQDTRTGRLTATADDKKYVGNGWMPVVGLSATEAKALAVFINSTAGRLQLMRQPSKKLAFPSYSTTEAGKIRIPNIKDAPTCQTLSDCWERTKDMTVPKFRDGECEVRRLWDEAVADATGWDVDYLARLREQLNREPHVRGLSYNQYADEA